jgi:hypothetical protein
MLAKLGLPGSMCCLRKQVCEAAVPLYVQQPTICRRCGCPDDCAVLSALLSAVLCCALQVVKHFLRHGIQ